MIEVTIKDCNNIQSSNIQLKKNKLNIRYAMNGTGKSTIARAIDYTSRGESLALLKPFDVDNIPSCTLSEKINKVMLFNEDFVNNIVFRKSEVIQNSFDVFIKTPEYDEKQKSIKERLKRIHIDTQENKDLETLLRIGQSVLSKLQITKTGDFKQSGIYKSLTSTEGIFDLPTQIKKFQPLMDKDYRVDWVGWKNDGAKYDDNKICPFCTNSLDNDYEKEKALFTSSYSKSNVKNILEMLSYFDEVKVYMNDIQCEKLYHYVREGKDESSINQMLRLFYDDLHFIVEKIEKVFSFNSYNVKSEDISRLDIELENYKIDTSILTIINNKKVIEIVDFINNGIDSLLIEINDLK